jgi:hypothetical protein
MIQPLNLKSTSSRVSLPRLRNSPLDFHTSKTSGSDHASIDRALWDELGTAGR